MIKYITTRPLWFNILVGVGLVIILFLLFMFSLNWITKHGEAKNVPAVTGKNINDVEKQLSDAGFETVIQDSVYYDSLPPGVVVKQVPDPDQVVKVNRTVYVTINRFIAPDISMPNIIGYSFRNAQLTLESLGLKLGDTTFKPDFAKNAVREQLFNGKEIAPGDKIKVGSRIDLVLGSGLGDDNMAVPKLTGLTLADVKVLLEQDGLSLGSILPDATVKDMDNAFVVRQDPMPRTSDGNPVRIRPGQLIDIWLSANPPVDSTQAVTPPPPPQNPQ